MMEIDYNLLAVLHRILRQQSDLTDRIEQGPRKIRVAEINEAKFATKVEEVKSKLLQTKMAADEKQLHLSEREAKVDNLKARLNACDSNKEYQLLKDSIAADNEANGVLSDEIFEMLERIDSLEVELADANKALEKAKQDKENVVADVNQTTNRLNAELAEIKEELATNEKRLRGEVAAEYKRLSSALGESALAKTDGKTCGNCYHTFTTQTYSELRMRKAVFCKGCGSLMYMNSGVEAGREV